MGNAKRCLPEVASVLTGLISLSRMMGAHFAMQLTLTFFSALVCAIVYRWAGRPSMWRHWPLYMAPLAVFLFALGPIFFRVMPLTLMHLQSLPALLFLTLLFALIISVPTLPVYLVYSALYKKRFAQKAAGQDSGEQS